MRPFPLDPFKNVDHLPTPSDQIAKVLEEIQNTTTLEFNVVKMIQYDPSIASRILMIANDPFYGFQSQVDSLQQAVALLGPGIIKSIILTTPIFDPYSKNVCLMDQDFLKIWIHSAVTGVLASGLSRFIRPLQSDVCFTAGLIQDIGKIALIDKNPEALIQAADICRSKKIFLDDAVREILGCSIGEIAAQLGRSWNFPPRLIEILQRNYLLPMEGKTDKYSAVVLLAKDLAFQWGYSDGLEQVCLKNTKCLLDILEVTEQEFRARELKLKQLALEVSDAVIDPIKH